MQDNSTRLAIHFSQKNIHLSVVYASFVDDYQSMWYYIFTEKQVYAREGLL